MRRLDPESMQTAIQARPTALSQIQQLDEMAASKR